MLVRRYPIVAGTVLVGLVVAALSWSGFLPAARLAASSYAIGIAAYQGFGMIRDIRAGRWGIDLLAVTAILSTVVVGEYVAALIIVLMLSGGKALEDFASGRAKRELSALLARAPQTAHRERGGGPAEDIPVGDVKVGDLLLVQAERGFIALVEANPSEYKEVARMNALSAKTWNTPALAGELLLVRNDQEAACYRLPKAAPSRNSHQ